MKSYKICNTCIIDNSYDVNVEFYDGKCSYCKNYDKNIKPLLKNNFNKKKEYASNLVNKIKKDKKKYLSSYDCLIGVSGGVDSSFLVYHAVKNLKLNPLIYHVDTGWNNKIAVSNIEKILEKFELDLHTEVIDWN